jgi:hypothetical protein
MAQVVEFLFGGRKSMFLRNSQCMGQHLFVGVHES